MKSTTARLALPLAALALVAVLDAGAKQPPPSSTMADHYRAHGWGVWPFTQITKLGPMGGRPAPVPYPQLNMKQPLENMICRTDHKDRGQKTWQVGTQWGNNCIYAWAGTQDMNGADRSDVLLIDPAMAPRFQFQPVRFKVIATGKSGQGRKTVVANEPLLPFGSGYDFEDAVIGSGGRYDYNVCRVKHRDNLWHYGKLRAGETQCMYAGNAKGIGITSGYEVLVLTR